MTLLRGCVLQVLSFDDCVEKIESVGNTTRIQSVLETLRAEESKKYTPTDEMEVEESAARNLSEELDDELPDHPDTSAKTTGTDAVGAGSEMPQSADEMEEIVGSSAEHAGIKEDTTEECEKFGPVAACKVPFAANDERLIYVRWETMDGAAKAMAGLHGRKFAGRTVAVAPRSRLRYIKGRLTTQLGWSLREFSEPTPCSCSSEQPFTLLNNLVSQSFH